MPKIGHTHCPWHVAGLPRTIVSSSSGGVAVSQFGSLTGQVFRPACDGSRQSLCPAKLPVLSWLSQAHTVMTVGAPELPAGVQGPTASGHSLHPTGGDAVPPSACAAHVAAAK